MRLHKIAVKIYQYGEGVSSSTISCLVLRPFSAAAAAFSYEIFKDRNWLRHRSKVVVLGLVAQGQLVNIAVPREVLVRHLLLIGPGEGVAPIAET